MERGLAFLLVLCLGLPPQGRGQDLEVEPPEPEVAVAVGGWRQLTCRLACPGRGPASVQWRNLDTSLGRVQSIPGSSVLTVRNATLSAAGTRMCVGSCGTLAFQRSVRLLVYAFPDQLSVCPTALVSGQDQEVACTAHNITPMDFLSFSLLLEDQELEGAQALGWKVDEAQEEDPLFHVTQRWRLPPLGTPGPAQLHCQATMQLPGMELSHRRPIRVLHSPPTLEPPTRTTLETPTSTILERSTSAAPEPPTLNSQEPPTTAPLEPPAMGTVDTPTLSSPEQSSSLGPCRPEILQSPVSAEREARWELLCKVSCGSPGVTVHWTQAPGGLTAYKLREAGAQAWLSLQLAGRAPEGLFQCRVDPGHEVASLYIMPVAVQLSATLWTGSLALGLLLLAFLAYRLRSCCRALGWGHSSSFSTPMRHLHGCGQHEANSWSRALKAEKSGPQLVGVLLPGGGPGEPTSNGAELRNKGHLV
ncbi:mucosal addressin cell adhesion molecule 1 [Orycteropus afer afer]|uniref:Mucosal addressin cell adhesion molecule 1 n=1 Tax=Orycteropus afer afer TaxID=1230840 RepID=A0A8B7AYX6_ORYAF|nr:mucosal addressin cell adhesion molecule 1 [Orycteropus afer afer]